MAKPVVFVIGASGNIGAATVSTLSASYADKVEIRAGVRNPDKADKLKELTNVQVVKAEMGSSDLASTLKGVDTLYIVVPGAENRTELSVKTAQAAKAAGVKFLLVVSVLTADLSDTIFGKQMGAIEAGVKDLGVPHCFVRLPFFTDNVWGSKASIQGQSSMYGPAGEGKQYSSVVVADAGKAAAAILASPDKHSGKTYNIVSHRITNAEVAQEFTTALGKEVKYVKVPFEDAKKAFMGFGLPEWQAEGIMELFRLWDADSPVTNVADLSHYETITGEKPTSLKDYINAIAGAFKWTLNSWRLLLVLSALFVILHSDFFSKDLFYFLSFWVSNLLWPWEYGRRFFLLNQGLPIPIWFLLFPVD